MFRALFTFLLLVATSASASQSRNLTIFSEQNLSIPLSKIARQYSRAANVIVSLNFTSAENLMTNIDDGEPVDLFISANSNWIDKLHQKGVVDIYNIGYIAQDEMVIAMQNNNVYLPQNLVKRLGAKDLRAAEVIRILDQNRSTVIIDEPNNSSGYFARKLLTKFKASNVKVFSRLSEDKTPLLTAIENSPKNYSILLKSQIHGKNNFRILAKSDEKIFYQALVIAGDNMQVAREFIKFLKREQSKQHLKNYDFIVN